jgi:hypothetical protein
MYTIEAKELLNYSLATFDGTLLQHIKSKNEVKK